MAILHYNRIQKEQLIVLDHQPDQMEVKKRIKKNKMQSQCKKCKGNQGLKHAPAFFQMTTTVVFFSGVKALHLCMTRHQVRESLPQIIAC